MHDATGSLDPLDHRVRLLGDLVLERQGAVCASAARDGLLLLRRDRETLQGARCLALAAVPRFGHAGGGERLLEGLLGKGVDLRLDGFGTRDDRAHQLDR